MKIAVLGLGEAGAIYASALAESGHQVVGYDPIIGEAPLGVKRTDSADDAIRATELVLAFVPSHLNARTAIQSLPALDPDTVYADFSAASPMQMEEANKVFEQSGHKFVDVAVLAPVPLHGISSELMASGADSEVIGEVFQALGATVTLLDAPAGGASSRKLLRSIFMKGLAAVISEAIDAGRAAGSEEWIRGQIDQQLAGDGSALIDRFLEGTQKHAVRRSHEMAAAVDYLQELNVPFEVSGATKEALLRKAGAAAGK